MGHPLIDIVEKKYLKANPPEFEIGDTVDVHTRIVEGQKERIQVFSGVVISRRGEGLGETFTVRRIVANQGVERKYMVHTPLILKVEVKRHGKVRRAKLYYLRDRIGKARRLRERRKVRSASDSRGASKSAASSQNVERQVEPVGAAGDSA